VEGTLTARLGVRLGYEGWIPFW